MARSALRRKSPPQQGQASRVCLEVGDLLGGERARVRAWGGRVGRRWSAFGRRAGAGGLGLTMSEEGGLDEVEESLRAGELLAQLGDLCLESIHLRLQPLAAGTGDAVRCLHADYSMSGATARLGALQQLCRGFALTIYPFLSP